MSKISDGLRQAVILRAKSRCEYCQTLKAIVVGMEVDHILPTKHGGQNNLDNLCLACRGCNQFKRDFLDGVDPQTGSLIPLFNPRQQLWQAHFQWDSVGIELVGKDAIGRATIARLQMNREAMIESRRLWVSVGWHPPK
ncbi:MAG: HNH endonuclease [Phototrophicaceae bacterium]|jgi:hypothetical protein